MSIEREINYSKTGVVAFVFCEEGQMLVTRESTNNDSTGKVAGEHGTLCETTEQQEKPYETLQRGFFEELGVLISEFKNTICQIEYRGLTDFIPGVGAHVYVVQIRQQDLTPVRSEEVSIAGWYTIDGFNALKLRRGVRNVFSKAVEHGWLVFSPF